METYETKGKEVCQVICDTRTILKGYKTEQTENYLNGEGIK